MLANCLNPSRRSLLYRQPGGIDHIVNLGAEHAPYGFIQQAPTLQARVGVKGFAALAAEQRHILQLLQAEQARAHAVIHVVGVVGNFIGQIGQLRLQAGLLPKRSIWACGICAGSAM